MCGYVYMSQAGVLDSCELFDMAARNQIQVLPVLQEQFMLLTSQPSV